mgnify:FL=1
MKAKARRAARLAMRCIVAVLGAVALDAMAGVPTRGVPAGCDPSVMSAAYWATWNADEQAKIDADIERNRKANCETEVSAPEGAEVKVEQRSHAFRFGAHIFNFNQLGSDEYNEAYKASYGNGGIFNQATVAFYWNKYEPVPGRLRFGGDYEDTARFWNSLSRDEALKHPFWRRPAPGPVIDFLKGKGVAIHGHILVWGEAKPFWIYDWYCPEDEKRAFDALGIRRCSEFADDRNRHKGWCQDWGRAYGMVSEFEIAALAPTFVRRMPEIFRKRIFDVAKDVGAVADSWDVVNESSHDQGVYKCKSRTGLPIWKSWYGLMPGDYPLRALLDAKEAFPPEVRLAINDWNITEEFLNQVEDLEKEGARIDIVGCQMHMFDTNTCMQLAMGKFERTWNGVWIDTPTRITERLDMMARTGRPIHVSEVTIAAPGEDVRSRMIQAILTRNIYRKWFSHRATMGITWWNTVDGVGAKGEPLVSGLFTVDMKKKPAYHALDQLINREWRTDLSVSAKNGKVSFRGFRGRYRLSWKDADGRAQQKFVVVN